MGICSQSGDIPADSGLFSTSNDAFKRGILT